MKKITLTFFCMSSLTAFAQNTLTPEMMFQFSRIGGLRVSPDGKTMLYTISNTDLAENKSSSVLMTMPVTGGTATQIAAKEDKVISPKWRPDGKKICYLHMESGEPQLMEMNPDGSGKKKVSSVKGGVENFIYSPDMKHILFTQDVQVDFKDEKLYKGLDKTTGRIYDGLNMRHWDTWNEGAYTHVFYCDYTDGNVNGEPIDILKGERFDAPVKPFGGDEQLAWSGDGSIIIYTSKKEVGTKYAISTNSDLYAYNINTKETENITPDNKGYDQDPQFSPDGSKLAYLCMKTPGYESDKNRLIIYDWKTKTRVDLTENLDQTVDAFSWSIDGKSIYFISPINATKMIYEYNFAPKKNQPKISQLTADWWDYNFIQSASDGKRNWVVGGKVNFSHPTDLYLIDPVKKIETQLTEVNKEMLSKIKFGKVEKRMVKTVDGKEMLTWLIYPPDFNPAKKYPTLLYCQGGPQSVVSQFWSSRWSFQLMAANGYIVVAPNRRGLPSFGQAWNDAIIGDYGGKCMQDYLSAIDDAAKEPFVDKDRMGAVGASFGGYSVYWLAGNHNKRFKAFIAHCGMYNMESWYGSTEEMFFANNDQKGPYWSNPKNYELYSPHRYVKNWDAPILVIHNEKDFRVPLGQGLEAFTAAQIQGVPSRFLYFPDENHWVTKPQNSILWQRVFYDWLDKWLKK
ncbi:MAG: S9 family peptidase [Bacteroidetes bacterium]|nr:S9 family peptidase [Bacteroidota bacterium]